MSRVDRSVLLGVAGLCLLLTPAGGLHIAWLGATAVAAVAARDCLARPRSSPLFTLGLAVLGFAAERTVHTWLPSAWGVRLVAAALTAGLVITGAVHLHRRSRRPVEAEAVAEVVGLVGLATLTCLTIDAVGLNTASPVPWMATVVALGGLVMLSSIVGHGPTTSIDHLTVATIAAGSAVAASLVVANEAVTMAMSAVPLLPLAMAAGARDGPELGTGTTARGHGTGPSPEPKKQQPEPPGRPAVHAAMAAITAAPALLAIVALWPAVAGVETPPAASPTPRAGAVAVAVAGAVASLALAARMALVIRSREWLIERERDVGALAETLVRVDDSEKAVAATVATMERLTGGRAVVGIVEEFPNQTCLVVDISGPTPTRCRPTTAPPHRGPKLPPCVEHLADAPGLATAAVPGPEGHIIFAASDRRFRAEVDEMIRVAANQLAVALEVIRLREAVTRERADRQFRALAQASSDLILVVDPDTLEVGFAGPTTERLVGRRETDFLGTSILDHVDPADREVAERVLRSHRAHERPVEVRMTHRDGSDAWFELSTRRLDDGSDLEGLLINLLLIDDRMQAQAPEERLERRAVLDPVTGLLTRVSFQQQVTTRLQQLTDEHMLAVIHLKLLDLDDINDAVGVDMGNRLLAQVADRLQSAVRGVDAIGRIGTDELAVTAVGLSQRSLSRVAERLIWLFEGPFQADERSHELKVAAGMALSRPGLREGDQMMQWASAALHHARQRAIERGLDEVVVYDQDLQDEIQERFELTAAMRPALESGQFHLHYQPLISLASDRVESFEALLRWTHPEKGSISPGTFIPLAERSGLIVELGRWVLHEACRQLVEWRQRHEGFDQVSIGVNLSARQLERHGELDALLYLVDGTGLDYGSLTVELTESIMIDDRGWIGSQLQHLRELGTRIAIDDFGTGAAGLSHLRQLPYDVVKIDKSYIDQVGADPTGERLVVQIIELAQGMDAVSVAEGIETGEQLQALKAMGCDIGQGFHLARPMTPDDLERWMAERGGAEGAGGVGQSAHPPPQASARTGGVS